MNELRNKMQTSYPSTILHMKMVQKKFSIWAITKTGLGPRHENLKRSVKTVVESLKRHNEKLVQGCFGPQRP